MVYAIFTRRSNGYRAMHAVPAGGRATVCGHEIGRGTGLVRDGDYHNARPCLTCWPSTHVSRKP